MYFDKWSGQGHEKPVRALARRIKLLQTMKGAQCDVAAVAMGNDKLSGLRILSVFSR
jgi:hypothetical protein